MSAIRRWLHRGPARGVGLVVALALTICLVGAVVLALLSLVMTPGSP